MDSNSDAPVVVGIAGKIGCGKDYTAGLLGASLPAGAVLNLAFADQIKVNVSVDHSIPLGRLMGSHKSDEDRRLLQIEGTEKGRAVRGGDVWINTLARWVEIHAKRHAALGRPLKCVVVTDCRFPNEVDWVLSQPKGVVLHLKAPRRNAAALTRTKNPAAIAAHPSETSLDSYAPPCVEGKAPSDRYLVINNDPEDDLKKVLRGKASELILSGWAADE